MHRLALLAALVAIAPLPLGVRSAPQGVTATAVPLDPADPGRTTLGSLRYLGGWVLKGTDRRFGGVSSMTIEDGHFTMLSDGGVVTRLRFAGQPGPVADYAMSELPDGPGDGSEKVDRDSESSTYDAASGHVWAGFETRNEIWRYTKGFATADGHVAPKLMADWPDNLGAEAMVRLADGRFLVFAETKTCKDGTHYALLFPGDPVEHPDATPFCYKGPPGGFAPTDSAQLPDGRVIVLHRRFSAVAGFAAALTVIDPKAIVPGGPAIVGKVLATLAPPLTVDNMEALAVQPTPHGLVLWVASDDNYFFLERTLLMAFALPKAF
ncbi:esterase-like activity of phytase family protein [Sphingomonas sp. CGMCC 1.13654]|uniref:Esterase-like activity of phytase family protein n=1 Tax=Sphingomonas chungangi TaxID=2683589 RepID=A0A838L8T2_9SPHN|nr:esterase-like activity of phytase family protein [Sphingomonas chungangi]MBA2935320.1 esterase-like activity of phytase family protein [Sphingomonas chungangi]MVW56827.1 esterase-like activity of phytase family protein [Sphingomonas chungangi]